LTVVDLNGCEIQTSFSTTEPMPIQVSTGTNASTCGQQNGSAFVSVIQSDLPLTFNWSDGTIGSSLNNVPAGIYTVIGNDSTGCSITETVTIAGFDAPVVTATATDAACFGEQSGAIQLTLSSSSPITTIHWSNGTSTANLTNVAAGSYTFSVVDSMACETTGTVVVNEPDEIQLSVIVGHAINNANGTIDLTVNPAGSNYSFLWSTGDITEDISGLAPGTYTVTVTNSSGCSSTSSAVVNTITAQSELNGKHSIAVYPNPNRGAFTISASTPGTYQLINTAGQIVDELHIETSGETTFELGDLKAGVYQLQSLGKPDVQQARIVVQE